MLPVLAKRIVRHIQVYGCLKDYEIQTMIDVFNSVNSRSYKFIEVCSQLDNNDTIERFGPSYRIKPC